MIRVRIGEQEVDLLLLDRSLQGLEIRAQRSIQLVLVLFDGQLQQSNQVASPGLQAAPGVDLFPEPFRFLGYPLGAGRVLPDGRVVQLGLDAGDAVLFAGEVKDAPGAEGFFWTDLGRDLTGHSSVSARDSS